MDNNDSTELFETLEDNTILIKADQDLQTDLQNYVISAKGDTLAQMRGNLAYEANNRIFGKWWA